MALLFVFLDGVGLGPDEGASNPLARARTAFDRLAGGPWVATTPAVATETHVFRPLDATLGVSGLPQSGTGQASLFSGVNCAALAGQHYGPFPHSTSKPVLDERNLFLRLQDDRASRRFAFANAFPSRFFEVMEARNRWTVTTRCCHAAGVPLRRRPDLVAGDAVFADLDGLLWPEPGPDLATTTPQATGRTLAALAQRHTLTLFEYWMTDKAGHSQDAAWAHRVLDAVDAFLGGVLETLDPARDLLVLTSDHGNLEDLTTKTHTRHPVPLIAYSLGAAAFAVAHDLTAVLPALEAVAPLHA